MDSLSHHHKLRVGLLQANVDKDNEKTDNSMSHTPDTSHYWFLECWRKQDFQLDRQAIGSLGAGGSQANCSWQSIIGAGSDGILRTCGKTVKIGFPVALVPL
jgi:hypothetical protein